MNQQAPTLPPDAHRRVIDGVQCTDRDAIAALLGKSAKAIAALAADDPAFPKPVAGRRIERRWWYAIDDVTTYAALLDYTAAAQAWGVTSATFRMYLYRSKPKWITGHRAIVPPPDVAWNPHHPDATAPHWWRWHPQTITGYERLGERAGAGRPPRTRTT